MKRNIIKFQFATKLVDLDLECVEYITVSKSFDYNELLSAMDSYSNDEYFKFQTFLKRYLLRYLQTEYTTLLLEFDYNGSNYNIELYHSNNSYIVNDEIVKSSSKGEQIKRVIDKVHTIINLKNHRKI